MKLFSAIKDRKMILIEQEFQHATIENVPLTNKTDLALIIAQMTMSEANIYSVDLEGFSSESDSDEKKYDKKEKTPSSGKQHKSTSTPVNAGGQGQKTHRSSWKSQSNVNSEITPQKHERMRSVSTSTGSSPGVSRSRSHERREKSLSSKSRSTSQSESSHSGNDMDQSPVQSTGSDKRYDLAKSVSGVLSSYYSAKRKESPPPSARSEDYMFGYVFELHKPLQQITRRNISALNYSQRSKSPIKLSRMIYYPFEFRTLIYVYPFFFFLNRELAEFSDHLNRDIKALDSEMQMMVYDNYNKFISATDTIREMKGQVESMELEMNRLMDNMKTIEQASNRLESSFENNRAEIEKLVGVRDLLKQLEFLFDLPQRLKQNIKIKSYGQAIKYYKMATSLLRKYGHIKSFRDINTESQEIMENLQQNLKYQMIQPNASARQQLELASHLLQLDEPPEHLWYDILRTRKEALLKLIVQLKTSEVLQKYYEYTQTVRHEAKDNDNDQDDP
ncbi:hypothetical protein RFI_04508, partial [Reticulomyxa filosa]